MTAFFEVTLVEDGKSKLCQRKTCDPGRSRCAVRVCGIRRTTEGAVRVYSDTALELNDAIFP
jgi:hypothetical protein